MRILLTLVAVLLIGCSAEESKAPHSGATPDLTPSQTSTDPGPVHRPIGLTWTSSGSTATGSLTARIRTHAVALGGTDPTELTFATLERDGRILQRFDGVQHIVGNETRVSFVDLSGVGPVLAVEQETYRDWRFWIVATSPRVRSLIDSRDWGVGHNLRIEDIDGDGCVELVQSSLHYWFFDRFNNVDSPFPQVIFHFDSKKKRFLPANRLYSTHVDLQIAKLKASVDKLEARASEREAHGSLLGAVVAVVLELCYAERASEAWAYFDQHYALPDAAERRGLLQRQIARDPVLRESSHSRPAN